MEDSWIRLHNLEEHIKAHNSHIEQLSPTHSQNKEILSVTAFSPTKNEKLISLKKTLLDRDREIAYLKRENGSLDIHKEQQVLLEKQLKLMEDKLICYENTLTEKSRSISQIEVESLPKKLQSEQIISELKNQLEEAHADIQRKGNKITHLKAQLVQYAEIEDVKEDDDSEKDEIILALEEDNEKLRSELEKAMDSLQKCQKELSFIGTLRKELTQSEDQLKGLKSELRSEKNLRNTAEITLKNLESITDGIHPVDYIEDLLLRLSQSNEELSQIHEDINAIEKKQKISDEEIAMKEHIIYQFIEKMSLFIENLFLKEDRVFTVETDLDEPFSSFELQIHKKHEQFIRLIKDKDKKHEELSKKVSQYKSTIVVLTEKKDKIILQLKEQEALYYTLNTESQALEAHNRQLSQELCEIKGKLEKVEEVIFSVIDNRSLSSVSAIQMIVKESKTHRETLAKAINTSKKLYSKVSRLQHAHSKELEGKDNKINSYIELEKALKSKIDISENRSKELNSKYTSTLKKHTELSEEFIKLKSESDEMRIKASYYSQN